MEKYYIQIRKNVQKLEEEHRYPGDYTNNKKNALNTTTKPKKTPTKTPQNT